jgi:hypothetical protein
MCLFSAKGAMSSEAWGNAPGFRKARITALKARFIPVLARAELTTNQFIESRFSAGPMVCLQSWGVAPGFFEDAPSVLKQMRDHRSRLQQRFWLFAAGASYYQPAMFVPFEA